MAQFVTRPYQPENRRRNDPDTRLVYILTENGPSPNAVGGIFLFRDKCFIFAADDADTMVQYDIQTIFRCAKNASWNKDPRKGLENMRKYFSTKVKVADNDRRPATTPEVRAQA